MGRKEAHVIRNLQRHIQLACGSLFTVDFNEYKLWVL